MSEVFSMSREETVQAVLFDFVVQLKDDRARGVFRSLSEYLQRFPECEEEIALEFCRSRGGTSDHGAAIPSATAAAPSPKDSTASRYRLLDEIARGGMGRILRVRDENMLRDLAMKVALRGGRATQSRLAQESLVTGKLDHPGIVPVHERGVDGEGRAFFTMRLVEGRDLRDIIRMVHRGEGEWSLPRALEVVLKVCDTLAYAHSRGVVHRDLKAANVRVGNFGEVYVMDWGLAKTTSRPDPDDSAVTEPKIDDSDDVSPHEVETARWQSKSPSLTLDGDVIGTPCTMSPEQAAGRIAEIGPWSDVYSVGAMLYELLSGRMPYVDPGESPSSPTILNRVLAGPPLELRRLATKGSPELIAICEKAMARDPKARYPNMREMAADLRAYLELRVVSAYRTGRAAKLAKWISRNRWLSGAIAATIVVAIVALIWITILQGHNQERLRLVADSRAPQDLVRRFEEIHPDDPTQVAAMESWLFDAEDIMSRRESYRRELDGLRKRALPWNRGEAREQEAELERNQTLESVKKLLEHYRAEEARMKSEGGLSDERETLENVRARMDDFEKRAGKLERWVPEQLTWRFTSLQAQFRHDTIESLLPALEPFTDSTGKESLMSRMGRRLAYAREVEGETLDRPRAAWASAIASIQDETACPLYRGLKIHPHLGLIPIRRDPVSGLWEFLHRESGDPPALAEDGSYVLGPRTGIILVLVPGAEFEMGAQREGPELSNFDPAADPSEWTTRSERPSAVHTILAPFFISKYEVTQAQWRQIGGWNPGALTSRSLPDHVRSELHPAESVDWNACIRVMRQVGLDLPTEAQWEYAARAGTTTPWWTGRDRTTLEGAANLADRRARAAEYGFEAEWNDWPELDDGFVCHAPVGSFRANPFGLYDVHGNVSEWCRDVGATTYDLYAEVHIDTHERWAGDEGLRVRRGGSFMTRASASRSSARAFSGPLRSNQDTGLRPSRDLDR